MGKSLGRALSGLYNLYLGTCILVAIDIHTGCGFFVEDVSIRATCDINRRYRIWAA